MDEQKRVTYSLLAKLEPTIQIYYCGICHQVGTNILTMMDGRRKGEVVAALCDEHAGEFSDYLDKREVVEG